MKMDLRYYQRHIMVVLLFERLNLPKRRWCLYHNVTIRQAFTSFSFQCDGWYHSHWKQVAEDYSLLRWSYKLTEAMHFGRDVLPKNAIKEK